jgi:peptidoglycan/LPS O-acetylase OafA/YrhL
MKMQGVALAGGLEPRTQTSSGRRLLGHLHNFRGLAIAFIVATHCMSMFDWSDSPELRNVLARVVANGTIFFIFISGYLFHYLSHDFRALDYWLKKLRFVVLPYSLVSIPAILIFTWFLRRDGMRPGFYEQAPWMRALEFWVTGAHMAPFWFIPTIVVFFLAAPLLLRVFSTPRRYLLLPLLFVVSMFVPRSANPLLAFVHFLPVWVLGMACSFFRDDADRWIQRLFWVMPVIVLLLFFVELHWTRGTHSWYSAVQKAVLSVFLLEVFRRLGARADRWFWRLGSLSFGIFFLHSYVITSVKRVTEQLGLAQPRGGVIELCVAACLMLGLTMGLVMLLKNMLGVRSRMVIGV